jgi:hypothetical protein
VLLRASDQAKTAVQCTHIALPESELRIIDDSDALHTPIHSGTTVSNVKTVCEDGSPGQVRCTSTSLLALSDVRTKDEVKRIPDSECLENALRLPPTKSVYKYKHARRDRPVRGPCSPTRQSRTRLEAETMACFASIIHPNQRRTDWCRACTTVRAAEAASPQDAPPRFAPTDVFVGIICGWTRHRRSLEANGFG